MRAVQPIQDTHVTALEAAIHRETLQAQANDSPKEVHTTRHKLVTDPKSHGDKGASRLFRVLGTVRGTIRYVRPLGLSGLGDFLGS